MPARLKPRGRQPDDRGHCSARDEAYCRGTGRGSANVLALEESINICTAVGLGLTFCQFAVEAQSGRI